MMLFFFLQDNGTVDIIQKLGFPIAVAIGLLWFLYKVWTYITNKLDEKDALIKDIVDKSNEHRDKMITTQDNLAITQRDIRNILVTHTGLIDDIKEIINK